MGEATNDRCSTPTATFHPRPVRTAAQRPVMDATEQASVRDVWRTDAFVATLAHELRQPLTAMEAAIEVVRMAPGTEAARQATDLILRQLREMSRLVEDLVDAKRLACGKVTLRHNRLDLAALMREVAADVSHLVAERSQSLAIEGGAEPLWVDGDPQRLRQVLLNLLRNAVMYTPRRGMISLGIARNHSAIALRVGDTGRGIEAMALSHVFDLFSQATPQEGTGLGIGLNIAREIALLHGGSIEARSEGAGQGSEFILRLPAAAIQV
jgi:signal transduction histidine kinase